MIAACSFICTMLFPTLNSESRKPAGYELCQEEVTLSDKWYKYKFLQTMLSLDKY